MLGPILGPLICGNPHIGNTSALHSRSSFAEDLTFTVDLHERCSDNSPRDIFEDSQRASPQRGRMSHGQDFLQEGYIGFFRHPYYGATMLYRRSLDHGSGATASKAPLLSP